MEFWKWPISEFVPSDGVLPNAMITHKAFDAGGALDIATSLILPSGDVVSILAKVNALAKRSDQGNNCLGVWLGRYHPPSNDLLAALKDSDLGWVTNFPCCTMFGDAFGQQLSEVGTGAREEIAALSAFRDQGKRVMLTRTPGDADLPEIEVDALLLVIRSAEDLKAVTDGFVETLRAKFGKGVPIVVHGGSDGHLPRATQAHGLAAVLHLPSSVHGVSSDYKASSG